ncbi:MAG TPA: TonB C-terminal domain-containing protein [Steroidobacteraceae bacterium]
MDRRPWYKKAPMLTGVLVVLLLVLGMVWIARGLMASKQQKPERMVQNITVIRPPPPPPEQPPPPPPEKVQQQIQQQSEPEPTPDNAPAPTPNLGLDAEGGAGDDGFGLAARKGESGIGTGGAAFAWYTGKLKDEVNDRLASDPKLRAKKYTVGVRVWIESDGRIKLVRVSTSSGNHDIDSEIAAALGQISRLSAAPPLEMPQPITLQIVSRS